MIVSFSSCNFWDKFNNMEEKDIELLDKYIDDYFEKVTADNARQVIDDFDDNWRIITAYRVDDTPEHQSKYGLALVIFSVANYESPDTGEKDIAHLSELIHQYDADENVKYRFEIKQSLFFNLGSCWHKLGQRYDDDAIWAFKKYLFYLLNQSNHHSFAGLSAYGFRKCNEYLYKSLINEQLNISSPSEFNDPFDCPIFVLLQIYGDDVNKLILKAYNDSLKIACFSNNRKLLPEKRNELSQQEKDKKWSISGIGSILLDENGNPVYQNKRKGDPEEYLNSLMWAHYADYHRGVCVKYHFNKGMTNMITNNDRVVSYFRDVKYSDEDMGRYSDKDSISTDDAFFMKGKDWEYENELRYLYFDIESKGKHKQIDIPNCIEAVYFGIKCPQSDKDTIMKILKDKKLVTYDLKGNRTEKDIEFYQMKLDYKHFGRLMTEKL